MADDPFSDDDIFATPKLASKAQPPAPVPKPAPKKQQSASIFQEQGNDQEDDLFRAASAEPAKKSGTVPFLEEEEEDDIFAAGKSTKVDVEKEAKMQPSPTQLAAVQVAIPGFVCAAGFCNSPSELEGRTPLTEEES